MAVAGPGGLAPRRLVHPTLGRPVTVPANWPSATRLIPGLQRPLQVGDHIPDGPPGTAWFVVQHVEPPQLLVLHSTTHVPAAWRERLGASIDWVWTFALEDSGDGSTRLLVRTRARTTPWWLAATYVAALVPPTTLWRPECWEASAAGSANRRTDRLAGRGPAALELNVSGPGNRRRRSGRKQRIPESRT